MGKQLICLFLLSLLVLNSNCDGGHSNDVEYFIRNGLNNRISWNAFYLDSGGFSSEIILDSDGLDFTGGGGILDGDSVLFVNKATNDTIIYRNLRHGEDISPSNHFYNTRSWVEEEYNKFYYTVREEDFNQ